MSSGSKHKTDSTSIDEQKVDTAASVVADTDDPRPDDCECLGSYILDDPHPCWPCARDGFETPNPNPSEDDE